MKEVIPPVDKSLIKKELTKEFFVRPTNKANNEIYDITAHDAPNTMREIARLREVSYRAAGGSKGDELDIDDMDTMAVPYPQLKDWGIRPLKQAQEFRRFYETAYLSLEGKVAQDRKYKNYRDNDKNLYRSEGEMV